MVDACSWAAGEAGVDVDLLVETYFRGYRVKQGSQALAIARAALQRNGDRAGRDTRRAAAATPTHYGPRGFEALLLANGTEANHTSDESVSGWRP